MLKWLWGKMSSECKKIIDLNGIWKYKTDVDDSFDVKDIINEFTRFPRTEIPSNWQNTGLNNYSGSVWYVKEINIHNAEGIIRLNFEGADYFTYAWINERYLGSHEGYFQSFHFDIPYKYTHDGKNLIIVKINSPYEKPDEVWPLKKRLIKGIFNHHDCRPGGWDMERGQDINTGGIWNDVYISYGCDTEIEEIKVFSRTGEKVTIVTNMIIKRESGGAGENFIKYKITDPRGRIRTITERIELKKGINKILKIFDAEDPVYWHPWDLGEPALYKMEIAIDNGAEEEVTFGIRDVGLSGSGEFIINGKKLFLRGTNIIPEQLLSTLSSGRIKQLAALLKEANVNIVRVHAHVNRKELYEEFDRAGILVWQDFSLQWTYDYSDEFTINAVRQIKEMVNQLYNHPCIAFWCCHNEPGEQIHTLDEHLYNAVREEDGTRIIRKASNYEEHPYDGWYWGSMEHFAAAPMGPLVTEFGAQALPDIESMKQFLTDGELNKPDFKVWEYHNFQTEQTFNIAGISRGNSIEEFIQNSQEYQAELIGKAADFYRRKRFDGINGIFQFMFIDCWPSITWSVIDYYGKKKKGFEALKRVYQPLYVSINLRQSRYYAGKKLNIDIYIINDTDRDYYECRLLFRCGSIQIKQMNRINIGSNDTKLYSFDKNEIQLPESMTEGEYRIDAELIYNDKIISFNYFKISVNKDPRKL